MRLLEIFPGYKEQFQLARLRYQPRNLRTVDHTRWNPSTVFLKILEWLTPPSEPRRNAHQKYAQQNYCFSRFFNQGRACFSLGVIAEKIAIKIGAQVI